MIDLTPFRTDAGIVIDRATWAQLRATTPADALAIALCEASEGMPMPDAQISETRAWAAFNRLRAAPLEALLGPGQIELLRSPSTIQPNYHTRLKPPGNAASNYFFHRLRLKTPKAGIPSAWQKWHEPILRLRVFRRFLRLKHPNRIENSTVRLALHTTGATPSQFKPGVAKAVCELVQAVRVLDLSMGWGDRLAGFCASGCTRHYTGIDPNLDLHPLYHQQVYLYGTGKEFTFIPRPAEDVLAHPQEAFDLVFTSPPYFGTERYGAGTGHEASQSWSRYPSPDQWRECFLRPILQRAWVALRPGGILAINIADITQRGVYYPLCNWTRSIVESLPGSVFKFALGMRLQGGNYSENCRDAVSGEPIWMWSKGPRDLPMVLPGLRGPASSLIPVPKKHAATALPISALKEPIPIRKKAWWTKPGYRGSPPTDQVIAGRIIADYQAGIGPTTISRTYRISKPTIYRILDRVGVRTKPAPNEKPPARAEGFPSRKYLVSKDLDGSLNFAEKLAFEEDPGVD